MMQHRQTAQAYMQVTAAFVKAEASKAEEEGSGEVTEEVKKFQE